MLSNSRLLLTGVLLFVAQSFLSSQSASGSTPFTCPASITVSAAPSVEPPWQAESAKSQHKFERPSIYNGSPGKQEYELAPDETQTAGKRVRQTWNLADYRQMNLFVRCRYIGTAATVVTDIPTQLKSCVFVFQNKGGDQAVASPSFECK